MGRFICPTCTIIHRALVPEQLFFSSNISQCMSCVFVYSIAFNCQESQTMWMSLLQLACPLGVMLGMCMGPASWVCGVNLLVCRGEGGDGWEGVSGCV